MLGTWKGYYKYDNITHQKLTGVDKTNFIIIITSFHENCFSGVVTEDLNSDGMEGTGEITGHVNGEVITFKKLMPRERIMLASGERKYSDKKHPALYYTGVFSADKKELHGTWKFKYTICFLFGLIPVPYRPGKGTWQMTLR